MKTYNQPIDLIIQSANGTSVASGQSLENLFAEAGIPVSVPTDEPAMGMKKKGKGKSPANAHLLKTSAKDTEINPWDLAHLSSDALGKSIAYIEPNFTQEFVTTRKVTAPAGKISSKAFTTIEGTTPVDPDWEPKQNLIWHLDDTHSQLASAQQQVLGIDYTVRIGHLDTGYGKAHPAIPDRIKQHPLQRSFVDGEPQNDAHDPATGGFLKMPGHGTGTLGILAGGEIDLATSNGRFTGILGGAHFADVVPCRIAESVILIKTNAFAEALQYLTDLHLQGTPVHVVSMSMGGAPSRIWANAVNAAYEAGITLVTAAGNNFSGLPTRHVIYPARFGRVIAACGVTYDFKPYCTNKIDEMQGCFGPTRHMKKALSAFTPNTPWASITSNGIRFDGAGTSSATPQIAAAAAIYYRKYHQQLDAFTGNKAWMRVEAIRQALFGSAIKKVKWKTFNDDFERYFGNGILQANAALSIPVPAANALQKTEEDSVPWFPILNTIFKTRPNPQQRNRLEMFNTELAQLVYQYPELESILQFDDKEIDQIGARQWKRFTDAVIAHPGASVVLKKYLKEKSSKK